MKNRVFSLLLAILMVMCICGCKSEPDNSSSEAEIIETETIIIDESGETMTNSENSSEENVSSEKITSGKEPVSSKPVSSKPVSSKPVSTSSENKEPIEIDYNTVVEIDICNEIVRAYLDQTETHSQYFWLSEYKGKKFDNQTVDIDWKSDGSYEYTVHFSENSDFSDGFSVKVDTTKKIKNAILVPGKIYYWKVFGTNSKEPIGGGKIKVFAAPTRWIYIDGISNVRDMGGWSTTSGKTVKYGMLYRGAQLNTEKDDKIINAISEVGLETFNKLGIKTEFDLRGMQNVHTQTEGTNLNYVLLSDDESSYVAYDGIAAKSQKQKYKKMFEYLSDSSNYPIYTHCQGGADRTGTYAFLINGLLGVSYEDLTRDFELTSFANVTRWRSAGSNGTFNPNDADYIDGSVTVKWRALYNYIIDYGKKNNCTTLQQSIEHWFVNYVGVPQAQIDSFKSIMLE